MKFKSGFTLAELTVVLFILGAVTAMTVPSLLKDSNNKELKTGFVRAINNLNSAYNNHLEARNISCPSNATHIGYKYYKYDSSGNRTDCKIGNLSSYSGGKINSANSDSYTTCLKLLDSVPDSCTNECCQYVELAANNSFSRRIGEDGMKSVDDIKNFLSKYITLQKISDYVISIDSSSYTDCYSSNDGMIYCFPSSGDLVNSVIYVDVNGDKIPNRTIKVNGKFFSVGDRFTVKVTEDGFIPGTEHELRAFLE